MQICRILIMLEVLDRPQLHSFYKDLFSKKPWAHLDIAGMAFSKYGGALNSEGATGFGVRLFK